MLKTVAIADVATVNPTCPRVISRDTSRRVSFVPMAAVSADGYVAAEEERTVGQVSTGFTYFERGDVVVAKITPCVENGKAAHTTDLKHEVGFGTTEFHVLRPGPDIHGRYLFYMIWNPHFRFLAARNMTGSAGQRRVPADFVRRFAIPLPPLSEQKRIAAILDQADAIRRKRRAAAEATAALNPAGFCEMFGDPGTNPRHWPIVDMSEVVRETQYGTSSALEVEKRRYPVLRMNNITYSGDWQLNDLKWLDFGNGDVAKYTIRRGDLLFNRTNSPELVGKTAVWPYEEAYGFAGYLIRVRFDESRVLPEFVSSYLNSRFGKSLLFKSAVPSNNMSNISASTFRRLPLMLPPVKMQDKFVEYQDQVRRSTGRQRIAENECDALFHSLVHRAFRGEL